MTKEDCKLLNELCNSLLAEESILDEELHNFLEFAERENKLSNNISMDIVCGYSKAISGIKSAINGINVILNK